MGFQWALSLPSLLSDTVYWFRPLTREARRLAPRATGPIGIDLLAARPALDHGRG